MLRFVQAFGLNSERTAIVGNPARLVLRFVQAFGLDSERTAIVGNPARLVLRFVQAFGLDEYNAERMLVTQKQIAPGGCDSE